MKKAIVFLAAAAMMLTLAPVARAQEPGVGPSLGLKAILLPSGTFNFEFERISFDVDTEFAAGFSPFLDYSPIPYFSIGFGPQFIFNVRPDDFEFEGAGYEIDLNARLKGRIPVLPEFELYLLATPGYSLFIPPDTEDGRGKTWRGADFGIGGGASYEVTPGLGLLFEIGYQLGWQEPPDADEGSAGLSWLTIGLGIVAFL